MIFVTTAGKVGSAAARLIAQRDVPVRVLVRHPEKVAEKAAALAQAGVEIFPGDLDSPESIDQAMRDQRPSRSRGADPVSPKRVAFDGLQQLWQRHRHAG